MDLPLDYPTLRIIWWGLMGVLLIGFALTDGFDLGVASLLPFIARNDSERRMVINTIAPTWEGNQVWFILGGGAIFAAWPFVYAVSFSGFYLAMFAVLASLILRPVAFKYRSKWPGSTWRSAWDWALFVGGFVPTLVFGVAVGNVLQGIPFHLDSDLRTTYTGGFFGLFTPFTLLCGLLSVSMIVLHGAAWLVMKAETGPVRDRARRIGTAAGIASLVLFAAGYAFVAFGEMGFRVAGAIAMDGPSNPLHTASVAAAGAWLDNFTVHPWMWAAPALGFAGAAMALLGVKAGREWPAFTGSSLSAARDHCNRGAVDVSVHPAQLDRSEIEPNGVQCVVKPSDAFHHAGGDGGLSANRAGLHVLGVQDHVGPLDPGSSRHQPRPLLIRRYEHVVFQLGPGRRSGRCLRSAERVVARAFAERRWRPGRRLIPGGHFTVAR